MPVQPDIQEILDMMDELGLPALETMDAPSAREFSLSMSSKRPPGPDVAEITDGTFPGAQGDLGYRLYRPHHGEQLPVVVYFHGGGWVLGSHTADDPLCRDLAVRTGALVLSVDYRHGPENRFPAAPDDALSAVRWAADNIASLGGDPARIAVCGWSAGGNLAAVVCQRVRDEGGPDLCGQVLMTPVTDADFSRQSYVDNAEGYVLTTGLMRWFWAKYLELERRSDPMASPIQATTLADLPPALVITCEYDVLRDEGAAYAETLAKAGGVATRRHFQGHLHTSPGMVDSAPSTSDVRAAAAEGLKQFLGLV